MSGKTSEKTEELPQDTVFDLLSHQLRRELIRCLQKYEEPITLADAADELAVATHDATSLTEIDPETVKRIYMDLYHMHIPKLAEYAIVQYDQEQDLLFSTDRIDQLRSYLERGSPNDSPE